LNLFDNFYTIGTMKSHWKNILISFCLFALGVGIGILVAQNYLQVSAKTFNMVREGGYNFINPLLSCNYSEDVPSSKYKPITDKLKIYIEEHISNGDAQNISIYFRGLNSGRWSGVNENDAYSPASLLKVPLMIAYLRKIDAEPSLLHKEITYKQIKDGNTVETFKSKNFIKEGQTYSVDELIQSMIMYSDNNAWELLQNNIDQKSVLEVYSDLGIPISEALVEENMTPKIFSYIFRILYNATYLSKPMSQYALKLLNSTDFYGGLKSGVTKDAQIAHKFGERTVFKKDSITTNITLDFRELHDCGIIYYPQNPYLLCVMTKGADFYKLSGIIRDISSLIYKETQSGVLKI